ncbi:MAG: 50S ribosomal protein L9 [Acidobacteriota bacterium]|nr:50S ribosomal protein L9 [Acidobacteriota bacterium]
MDIILREDIENLGSRGDLVNVADGYARNFLLPRKKAVIATDSNRKIIEQERDAHVRRDAKLKTEFEAQAKLLNGAAVTIAQRVGENDQLFGSVTAQNIADQLELKGFSIERRKIQLDEPIRTLGEHKVTVRLHREVTAEVTVNVVKEG